MRVVRPARVQHGLVQIHGFCAQAIVCRIELHLLRGRTGIREFGRIQGNHLEPVVLPLDFIPDNATCEQHEQCHMHKPETRILPPAGQAVHHGGDKVYARSNRDALERRERNHAHGPHEETVKEAVHSNRRRQPRLFRIRLRKHAPKRKNQERDQQRRGKFQ